VSPEGLLITVVCIAMQPAQPHACEISVVISTRNRAEFLPGVLEAVFAQVSAPLFEVIVVDNGSTDDTSAVLRSLTARFPSLRPAREARLGVSHGRNLGLSLARAPIVAFTDDDVQVSLHWLATIARTLEAHPQLDWVGGRVLPRWTVPPPPWLTREHWAPLALLDYGDTPFLIDRARRLCLLTANLAVRTSVLHAVGGFSAEFPRCQDHELLIRLWQTGRQGLYCPDLVVRTDVPRERMTKSYHRMWHRRTARFYALMPPRELFGESGEAGGRGFVSLFGVPAFTYREMACEGAALVRARVTRQAAAAFHHELRVRHLAQYVASRYALHRRRRGRSRLFELREFMRELWRKKGWVSS
jgi:GT2 family glycosyltransferase